MIPAVQNGGGQQLLDLIQRLEARVAHLESVLVRRGPNVRLQSGGSVIDLGPKGIRIDSAETLRMQCGGSVIDSGPSGVRINSREIALSSAEKMILRADSDLILKGSRILQN